MVGVTLLIEIFGTSPTNPLTPSSIKSFSVNVAVITTLSESFTTAFVLPDPFSFPERVTVGGVPSTVISGVTVLVTFRAGKGPDAPTETVN